MTGYPEAINPVLGSGGGKNRSRSDLSERRFWGPFRALESEIVSWLPTIHLAWFLYHKGIFIGRWPPKILFSLKEKTYSHRELCRRLGGVSQRMLTRTLHSLESTGLVAKRITKSNTVAVEYSLTHLGSTIIAPLRGMCRCAKRYCILRGSSIRTYPRNALIRNSSSTKRSDRSGGRHEH